MKKTPKSLSVGFLYDDTLDRSDGVAQYVKTLGAWLTAQGHRTSYLVGETKIKEWAGGRVYSLARNQTVMFNGNRLSIPMPANQNRIRDILSQEYFDVLHVQVPYSPFMAKHVINSANDLTAIIGTFHIYPSSPWVDFGTRILRLLLQESLAKFDVIMSVSPPAVEFAKKTFGVSGPIIPNSIDIAKYAAAYKKPIKKQPNHIVFLGRLVKRKGCIQLLRAFKLLQQTRPDVYLTIAGDGPERGRLRRFVSRHRLEKKVRFTGFIDEKDKPSLLASADIACFPSLSGESFGIVLIEAMAAGAGVVAGGNNPGYSSVLDNKNELLFNPQDTEEFAAVLDKILSDKSLAATLHKWQQARVKRYDVNTVGPQIVDIYRQTIAKKTKRIDN